MAEKTKIKYSCSDCGYTTTKWVGKCPSCESWGTLLEEIEQKLKKNENIKRDISVSKITDIEFEKEFRISSEYKEFDRVLGGGITKGEVVLITGNPGIGKSTFLLQLSNDYAKNKKIIYITGEESLKQVRERSIRINANSKNLYLLNETNLENILSAITKEKPDIVVIDSIQTMYSEDSSSIPGSVSQIRDCSIKLIEIAKSNDISFFIVGHVTKDGKLAGPKLLEHMVDAVISFEGDENNYFRIVRSIKNRYGSTNEIAIFNIKENGIEEIENPSEFFISERDEKNVGSIITTSVEGSRVILFEIQTLVSVLKFGIPKRIIQGYERNRVEIILAIISKILNIDLNIHDVYLNVPGGIELKDRASDLALVFSLISTVKNRPISQKIAAIGEIGLRGEVRKVSFIQKRVKELEKLGFTGVYLPLSQKEDFENLKLNIKLNFINNISELIERI